MNRGGLPRRSPGYCVCCRWMRGVAFDYHGRDLGEGLLRTLLRPADIPESSPRTTSVLPLPIRRVERRPSGSGVWV